ncbi:MAG: hypothetical protein WDA71_07105 [Actinomycetota bacterium]
MARRTVALPLSLLVALLLTAPAFGATERTWAGTARSETTVLSANVGDTSIAVAIEATKSSNDLARAALAMPTAVAQLTLARVAGSDIGTVGTSATSGTDSKSLPAIALDLAGLLSGDAAQGSLASTVDAQGVRSILDATIAKLSSLGGLVTTDVTNTGFTTEVTNASASAGKTLVAGKLDVFNLGALLDSLRLDSSKLPLGSLAQILAGLGVAIPAGVDLTIPTQISDLQAVYSAMAAKRDQLAALVVNPDAVAAGAGGAAVVDQALADYALVAPLNLLQLLGLAELPTLIARYGLALPITSVNQVLTPIATTGLAAAKGVLVELDSQLLALLAELENALNSLVALVRGTNLVSVGGIQATLSAVAAETEATSAVVGSVGPVSVGATELVGSLDLVDPAAINSLVGLVGSKLSDVLGMLGVPAPTVEVMKIAKATGIDSGGYRFAQAGLTALEITIPAFTVPADLVLGGTGQAFATPVVKVSVGTTSVFSEYKVVAATTSGAPVPASTPASTPSPLPLTGSAALPALLGVLLLGSAVLARRLLRAPDRA